MRESACMQTKPCSVTEIGIEAQVWIGRDSQRSTSSTPSSPPRSRSTKPESEPTRTPQRRGVHFQPAEGGEYSTGADSARFPLRWGPSGP